MAKVAEPRDEGTLADAYGLCERIARDHYENFPVASLLLPRRMRRHVAAVYAFARTADDFADEGERSAGERQRLLDLWLARVRGEAAETGTLPAGHESLIFAALRHTIHECRLPVGLFEDLLSAFRQDTTTDRYATWSQLLDYCRRSANPVGRLVLRIAGHDDPRLDASSDRFCTALQLTNFWQDLARDWTRGRVYLPREDLDRCAARDSDLARGTLTASWRDAVQIAARRTEAFFAGGRLVCEAVRGRLGLELKLTWLGGRRILEQVARPDFDPFEARPALRTWDVPSLLWSTLWWRNGAASF